MLCNGFLGPTPAPPCRSALASLRFAARYSLGSARCLSKGRGGSPFLRSGLLRIASPERVQERRWRPATLPHGQYTPNTIHSMIVWDVCEVRWNLYSASEGGHIREISVY